MSRSGYLDDGDCDFDNWSSIRWRGAVTSALRGKRGQAFLREALAALDALPAPELIANDLASKGSFCTLGAVGRARGADLGLVDVEDHQRVAALFGVPHALACEIMWENDEGAVYTETPRARWERMRRWIVANIKKDHPAALQSQAPPSPVEQKEG